jgi:hypothetical protein
MLTECRHIMTDGRKCHAIAMREEPYCIFHMRVHGVMAELKKPSKAKDRKLEFAFPDSQVSIQLSLFQLLNAIGSGQIDPKRASQLLYCLQIATQNVAHNPIEIPLRGVACVTQAPEGDDMGPVCHDSCSTGDCGKCVEFEECEIMSEPKSTRPAGQTGKPLRSMPEMFKDAIWQSLSGLSRERYEIFRDSRSKSEASEPEIPLSSLFKT